jgi:hypothetical protein
MVTETKAIIFKSWIVEKRREGVDFCSRHLAAIAGERFYSLSPMIDSFLYLFITFLSFIGSLGKSSYLAMLFLLVLRISSIFSVLLISCDLLYKQEDEQTKECD